jgi:hypothetical protein
MTHRVLLAIADPVPLAVLAEARGFKVLTGVAWDVPP